MQDWPATVVKTAIVVTPIAAAARSASAKTMLADLPPSSNESGLIASAERRVIARAVAVEPVSVILTTSGWADSASPAAVPRPATTFTTPGGKPASANSAAAASTEHDAVSAGFT